MKQQKNKSIMMKHPVVWLLIICALLVAWLFIIPAVVGLILLIVYCVHLYKYFKQFNDVDKYKVQKQQEVDLYKHETEKKIIEDKEYFEQECIQKRAEIDRECSNRRNEIEHERLALEKLRSIVTEENFLELQERIVKSEKKLSSDAKKIEKLSYLYRAVKSYIEKYQTSIPSQVEISNIEKLIEQIEIENLMEPTVEMKLHNSDIKDLKKQFREINKQIDNTLNEYEKRYTTKGNLAIYRLMVVALRSELQNVLYTMKFGKLEDAEASISEIAEKYIKIAGDGNQSIAPTITRFVLEAKSLFLDAAKVEYEYYLRRERMKEEQRALREQMRQEAEERKLLEQQRKQMEKEESKYTAEMQKLREQIESASEQKAQQLNDRIAELEALLSKVDEKKDEIAKLQNGKAGYVYVISNLGSFGDNVFKIGMTRRLNPQERIDELGSASVPFSFDVHSFIFSEDAPALENAVHKRLNHKRVNKVNHRKEFFDISINELETLVYELEPSAEFNRTMAAEEYRRSLSMKESFLDFENDNFDIRNDEDNDL